MHLQNIKIHYLSPAKLALKEFGQFFLSGFSAYDLAVGFNFWSKDQCKKDLILSIDLISNKWTQRVKNISEADYLIGSWT